MEVAFSVVGNRRSAWVSESKYPHDASDKQRCYSENVDDFVVIKAPKLNKLQQASTRRRQVLVLQVLGNRLFLNSSDDRLGRRGSGVQIAPPRPNLLLIPKKSIDRRSIAFAVPLPLLCQNCAKTRTGFARLPVEFRQRLAFHLQLHLRILLEHLRIALAEQLRHPLVRDAAAEPVAYVEQRS